MSTATYKVAKPPLFNGNRTKYMAWRVACAIYIKSTPALNSDEARINFTLSYMQGGIAEAWKEEYVAKYFEPPVTKTAQTFQQFCTDLDANFRDADVGARALQALSCLRQQKMSVDEYTSEFRSLLSRSKITEQASIIQYYRNGLLPAIVDRIYQGEELPATFDKWATKASQLDQLYKARIAQKQGRSTLPSILSNDTTRDPNAMDVDRRKNRVALVKLTPAER